jgi:hypothetical protein
LLVLVVLLEVRFFVLAVPVVFFGVVFFAAVLFTVMLAVVGVVLLAVDVSLAAVFVEARGFVVDDLVELDFDAGAIASMRTGFFAGVEARTCRIALVCCSRVILSS